jgi:ribosomal protein L7/L12
MAMTIEQAEDLAYALYNFGEDIGAKRKMQNAKLDMIKFVRSVSGLGLKEAKDVVEKVNTERSSRK